MEKNNCVHCKYVNTENDEYSKFVEGFIRYECKLKGHTEWFDLQSNEMTKFNCNEFIEKEGKKDNGN